MTTTPHPIDLHVGAQIKAARKLQGMSQTQLARECGVTFQQIQKYESGANRVSASRLHEIAAILEQRPGAFFPQDATPKRETTSERLAAALQEARA